MNAKSEIDEAEFLFGSFTVSWVVVSLRQSPSCRSGDFVKSDLTEEPHRKTMCLRYVEFAQILY